jgi:hypothetical protein
LHIDLNEFTFPFASNKKQNRHDKTNFRSSAANTAELAKYLSADDENAKVYLIIKAKPLFCTTKQIRATHFNFESVMSQNSVTIGFL